MSTERELIKNLLRAGQIVGLSPREMTLNALEGLADDERKAPAVGLGSPEAQA